MTLYDYVMITAFSVVFFSLLLRVSARRLVPVVLAGSLCGCAALAAALPIITKYVTDAALILSQVESAVDAWYATNPNPPQQAQFKERLAGCRVLLSAALHATDGADDLGDKRVDEAFEKFKTSYAELADFCRSIRAPVHLAMPGEKDRALPGQRTIAPPEMLSHEPSS